MFVLSTGRVGTDTLARLLDLSAGIAADHEPRPLFRSETKEAYQHGYAPPQLAASYLNARLFASTRSDTSPNPRILRRALREKLVYVETSNRLTYIAPALATYFPLSRFIFLHRRPAEVVRSAMRRGYYSRNPWDRFRIEPRREDSLAAGWEQLSSFEKSCWYWRAVNEYSLEFMNSLSANRCREFSSEALFEFDHVKIRSLFEWIGVEPPEDYQVENTLSVRHNRQQRGDFPEWGKWSQSQQSRMWAIVEPVAARLGYDYDI